ncbi:MAG: hypothetical protein K8R36_17975 [Planctomycetales bacterium]|nr:hypothetical protein [Planctomycetales bacterium]
MRRQLLTVVERLHDSLQPIGSTWEDESAVSRGTRQIPEQFWEVIANLLIPSTQQKLIPAREQFRRGGPAVGSHAGRNDRISNRIECCRILSDTARTMVLDHRQPELYFQPSQQRLRTTSQLVERRDTDPGAKRTGSEPNNEARWGDSHIALGVSTS